MAYPPISILKRRTPPKINDRRQAQNGIARLVYHHAERAVIVKAGAAVHYSLDDCWAFCYFSMCGHIGPSWPELWTLDERREFSYTPCLLMKAVLHLRLSSHASTALFSCRFKCPCPPGWQQRFHGNADRAYNTLHFATQSRVPKGASPFGNPNNKTAICSPFAGSISPFVVSSPFRSACSSL